MQYAVIDLDRRKERSEMIDVESNANLTGEAGS
jgi:hypothetical protein